MTSSVLIKKIAKSYDGEKVVDLDFLEINSGEIFGILGPNGAGKSTSLRMLYGLTVPDRGEIYINGLRMPAQIREIKKQIGVVPQEDLLDEELSVAENLALFCNLQGVKKSEIKTTIVDILRLIKLEDRAESSISSLSGGMKRRLAIGRSLVGNPQLLILDEPTTGLDSQSRLWIWSFLRDLKAQGKTIIITTHYMEEAESLCDRVALIFKGSILLLGSPESLIKSEIGVEAVEATVKSFELSYYLGRLRTEKFETFSIGNQIYVYCTESERARIAFNLIEGSRKLIRPATLNDVFLKSTGFELIEDHK